MTAAGDAVLAVARSQVGVTEDPPGSNQVPYWDWWGANLGSWCAVFASWCCWTAGFPICDVDGTDGFVLVSNGTLHSYAHFEQAREAQTTADLQPGDVVLFSWYSWDWDDGVPVITDPEWAGWVAGDHTGIFAYSLGDGYFACVEGNTSQSSWDNGGAVLERTDRHISQVCGWWRPLAYGQTGGAPNDESLWNFLMTNDELIAKLDRMEQRIQDIYWVCGNVPPSDANWPNTLASRLQRCEDRIQACFWHLGNFNPDAAAWGDTVYATVHRIDDNTD